MQKTEPWYLAERAEHLAIVALTRLPNVSISRQPADFGIDLLVTILQGASGGRLFGVEVKGVRSIDEAVDERTGRLRPEFREAWNDSSGDASIPVGLLIFDMSEDRGYFGWLLAPVVPPEGESPETQPVDDVRIDELTEAKVEEIVRAVDDWYDARIARRGLHGRSGLA